MNNVASTHEPALGAANPKVSTLRDRLLALPGHRKRLLQMMADVVLVWAALWLSFYLRLDNTGLIDPLGAHMWLFLLAPALGLPVFHQCGLYKTVTRYAGFQTVATAALAIAIAATLTGVCILLFPTPETPVPRSIAIIYALLLLFFVTGLRLAMKQYFFGSGPTGAISRALPAGQRPRRPMRVVIYGAGAAGTQLAMALRLGHGQQPVAFVDDNPELAGRIIAGLPVHRPAELEKLAARKHAKEVLLAIPSASRSRRAEIIRQLNRHNLSVRTIPGLMDVASGRVKVQDLRDVDISDLLGRDPVQPDPLLFERCIKGKAVLVTGAGGSIGSELCRQILSRMPRRLILFEQCEFNLYTISQDLETRIHSDGLDIEVVPILNTVRSEERLFEVMSVWEVDTVYHAAAYKHVPMVERNIAEGIINNVFGTLCSAQAAIRAGVANFVLISTDKAVRPTSTMGSTKRLAELVLQALARERAPVLYGGGQEFPVHNPTRFTMVRFGNVLDSSGSVIPLFREQIRKGGPVTVTHPDITRYFMTIPEASQLVIQAGSMGTGGDVFVLDMGEPVKILDLAVNMIRLSGLSVHSANAPDGDIGILFTGLRPGEKLYEELLIGKDAAPTLHPKIKRANESHIQWEPLKSELASLEKAVKNDDYSAIRQIFFRLVDGYTPDEEMVDWLLMSQKHATDRLPALPTHGAPDASPPAKFGT